MAYMTSFTEMQRLQEEARQKKQLEASRAASGSSMLGPQKTTLVTSRLADEGGTPSGAPATDLSATTYIQPKSLQSTYESQPSGLFLKPPAMQAKTAFQSLVTPEAKPLSTTGTALKPASTFEESQANYEKLLQAGSPKAEWGEGRASNWDSLFGDKSPWQSEMAGQVRGQLQEGLAGRGASLDALNKSQGLANLMLNRRANAMRAGSAAGLAQAGQLGQAVGQNAMQGVERQIAQQAAELSLAQGAQRADEIAGLQGGARDRILNEMNKAASEKQSKDKGLLELYVGLAKNSPAAAMTAIKSISEDLGLNPPKNADEIDAWARNVTLLDPNRYLENRQKVATAQDIEKNVDKPTTAQESLSSAIDSVVSTVDGKLDGENLKAWREQGYESINSKQESQQGIPIPALGPKTNDEYGSLNEVMIPGARLNLGGDPVVVVRRVIKPREGKFASLGDYAEITYRNLRTGKDEQIALAQR